jgi:hypothetical protein
VNRSKRRNCVNLTIDMDEGSRMWKHSIPRFALPQYNRNRTGLQRKRLDSCFLGNDVESFDENCQVLAL